MFLPLYNICFVFFFLVLALFLVDGWFDDKRFFCLIASQISLCEIFTWVFKWISCENLLSQWSHKNGLIPKWTRTCLSSFEGVGNILWQWHCKINYIFCGWDKELTRCDPRRNPFVVFWEKHKKSQTKFQCFIVAFCT